MKKSITFRLITRLGIKISEGEYYDVSFFGAINRAMNGYWKSILLKYCMYSIIFSPFNYRFIRPYIWRKMGSKVGKNVFIGYGIWLDYNNANLIEIGDNVHITNMCLLLCHQRELDDYFKGDNAAKLSYKKNKIVIENGVMIGMNSTIMPGVRIGEGSIIGAKSLVNIDIPPWSVAAGNPVKVIRNIEKKS